MMGGSLAYAIKRKKHCKKIFAYDTCKKSLLFAKKNRLIDDYDNKEFALLKKSDIGLEPQISLLNKLDYLLNSNELQQIPWLMSHPSSKDRISKIVKLEKKWNKKSS